LTLTDGNRKLMLEMEWAPPTISLILCPGEWTPACIKQAYIYI